MEKFYCESFGVPECGAKQRCEARATQPPTHCLYDGASCVWSLKLELTENIFTHPECPSWANYAAVDKDGVACFFKNKPKKMTILWFTIENDENSFGIFSEFYDATDWENSLVKRPGYEEVEE